ncbi:Mll2313 protein [hydrothermal vent metagenome]|uniref:Mll2313 protein n=1 Tax=hydrothermal vent metagenome TaxID=652676 RepID=A0A3B1C6N9_9ZZZZ
MKINLFKLSSLFILLFFFTFTIHAKPNESQKKKSVLLVYGGYKGHKPEKFKDLFLPWLKEQGFDVVVSNSLDIYADKEKMKDFDLIVQSYTMGNLTKEESDGLMSAVMNGTGIAGCHGGLGDSFRGNTSYLFMVGGQFVAHPGGKVEYEVNIVNHNDPITKGLSNFKITSEQYYMLVDPGVDVLATTTFSGEHAPWIEGVVMPVVWKKMYGKGKVFYSSIGHSIENFDIEQVMKITKRGILWAMRD